MQSILIEIDTDMSFYGYDSYGIGQESELSDYESDFYPVRDLRFKLMKHSSHGRENKGRNLDYQMQHQYAHASYAPRRNLYSGPLYRPNGHRPWSYRPFHPYSRHVSEFEPYSRHVSEFEPYSRYVSEFESRKKEGIQRNYKECENKTSIGTNKIDTSSATESTVDKSNESKRKSKTEYKKTLVETSTGGSRKGPESNLKQSKTTSLKTPIGTGKMDKHEKHTSSDVEKQEKNMIFSDKKSSAPIIKKDQFALSTGSMDNIKSSSNQDTVPTSKDEICSEINVVNTFAKVGNLTYINVSPKFKKSVKNNISGSTASKDKEVDERTSENCISNISTDKVEIQNKDKETLEATCAKNDESGTKQSELNCDKFDYNNEPAKGKLDNNNVKTSDVGLKTPSRNNDIDVLVAELEQIINKPTCSSPPTCTRDNPNNLEGNESFESLSNSTTVHSDSFKKDIKMSLIHTPKDTSPISTSRKQRETKNQCKRVIGIERLHQPKLNSKSNQPFGKQQTAYEEHPAILEEIFVLEDELDKCKETAEAIDVSTDNVSCILSDDNLTPEPPVVNDDSPPNELGVIKDARKNNEGDADISMVHRTQQLSGFHSLNTQMTYLYSFKKLFDDPRVLDMDISSSASTQSTEGSPNISQINPLLNHEENCVLNKGESSKDKSSKCNSHESKEHNDERVEVNQSGNNMGDENYSLRKVMSTRKRSLSESIFIPLNPSVFQRKTKSLNDVSCTSNGCDKNSLIKFQHNFVLHSSSLTTVNDADLYAHTENDTNKDSDYKDELLSWLRSSYEDEINLQFISENPLDESTREVVTIQSPVNNELVGSPPMIRKKRARPLTSSSSDDTFYPKQLFVEADTIVKKTKVKKRRRSLKKDDKGKQIQDSFTDRPKSSKLKSTDTHFKCASKDKYVTKAEYVNTCSKVKSPVNLSLSVAPELKISGIKRRRSTFTCESDNEVILKKIDDKDKKFRDKFQDLFGSSSEDETIVDKLPLDVKQVKKKHSKQKENHCKLLDDSLNNLKTENILKSEGRKKSEEIKRFIEIKDESNVVENQSKLVPSDSGSKRCARSRTSDNSKYLQGNDNVSNRDAYSVRDTRNSATSSSMKQSSRNEKKKGRPFRQREVDPDDSCSLKKTKPTSSEFDELALSSHIIKNPVKLVQSNYVSPTPASKTILEIDGKTSVPDELNNSSGCVSIVGEPKIAPITCRPVESALYIPLMDCCLFTSVRPTTETVTKIITAVDECDNVAQTTNPPFINSDMVIVHQQIEKIDDDVIEITKPVPTIDLTDDNGCDGDIQNSLTDLFMNTKRGTQKFTTDESRITLYRSDENVVNNEDVEAVSACIPVPSLDVLDNKANLKTNSKATSAVLTQSSQDFTKDVLIGANTILSSSMDVQHSITDRSPIPNVQDSDSNQLDHVTADVGSLVHISKTGSATRGSDVYQNHSDNQLEPQALPVTNPIRIRLPIEASSNQLCQVTGQIFSSRTELPTLLKSPRVQNSSSTANLPFKKTVNPSEAYPVNNVPGIAEVSSMEFVLIAEIFTRHMYFFVQLCNARNMYVTLLTKSLYYKSYFKAELELFEQERSGRLVRQSAQLCRELQSVNIGASKNLHTTVNSLLDKITSNLATKDLPRPISKSILCLLITEVIKYCAEGVSHIPLIKVLYQHCFAVSVRMQTKVDPFTTDMRRMLALQINDYNRLLQQSSQANRSIQQRRMSTVQPHAANSISFRKPAKSMTVTHRQPFACPNVSVTSLRYNSHIITAREKTDCTHLPGGANTYTLGRTPRHVPTLDLPLQSNVYASFGAPRVSVPLSSAANSSSYNSQLGNICVSPTTYQQRASSTSILPSYQAAIANKDKQMIEDTGKSKEKLLGEFFGVPSGVQSSNPVSTITSSGSTDYFNGSRNLAVTSEKNISTDTAEAQQHVTPNKQSTELHHAKAQKVKASTVPVPTLSPPIFSPLSTGICSQASTIIAVSNSCPVAVKNENVSSFLTSSNSATTTTTSARVRNSNTVNKDKSSAKLAASLTIDNAQAKIALQPKVFASKTAPSSFLPQDPNVQLNAPANDLTLQSGIQSQPSSSQLHQQKPPPYNKQSSLDSSYKVTPHKQKSVLTKLSNSTNSRCLVQNKSASPPIVQNKENDLSVQTNLIETLDITSNDNYISLKEKADPVNTSPIPAGSEANTVSNNPASRVVEMNCSNNSKQDTTITNAANEHNMSEATNSPGDDLETIDLTWIDDMDETELQNEVDFVFVKLEPEENPAMVSPRADSGLATSLDQDEEDTTYTVVRSLCVCGQVANYNCACGDAFYCGQPCQLRDWPVHSKVCHIPEDNSGKE